MFKNNKFILILAGLVLSISVLAQETPSDLRNLIGIRAASGESELQSRGFVYVKSDQDNTRRWSNYWNGSRRLCITVATVNGRFDSIVTAPAFDCNRSTDSGSNSSSGVTLYEDYDQRGRSQIFTDGRYFNNRGQLGNIRNDRTSSVDVPIGFSVRLCDAEGTGYGAGACSVFGPGKHDLPISLDNRVSYVEVSQVLFGGGTGVENGQQIPNAPGLGRPGATVYHDLNFRGTSQSFGPGTYRFDQRQFGSMRNDEASSVIVQNGYRVRLCENEGAYGYGGGRCEEYGAGRYNLRYNDDASFIQVTRANNLPIFGGGSVGSILPVNVSDLVGVRAVAGEGEMRRRGFRVVDSTKSGSTAYTVWWRPASRQCLQVATANGRYAAITALREHRMCY